MNSSSRDAFMRIERELNYIRRHLTPIHPGTKNTFTEVLTVDGGDSYAGNIMWVKNGALRIENNTNNNVILRMVLDNGTINQRWLNLIDTGGAYQIYDETAGHPVIHIAPGTPQNVIHIASTAAVRIGKLTGLTGAGDLDVAGNFNVDGILQVKGNIALFGPADGTRGNFRLLDNTASDGYHYLQIGKSNSDTSAKLRITRYSSTSGIQEVNVRANLTKLEGRVRIEFDGDAESFLYVHDLGSNGNTLIHLRGVGIGGGSNFLLGEYENPNTGAITKRFGVDGLGNMYLAGQIETEGWVAPTLQNGWTNYNTATWSPVGYYKDKQGVVHLRGMVKDGTVPSHIFTLPAGYRPAYSGIYAVRTQSGPGECRIHADGNVQAYNGSNGWFSLEGITFRAA